MEDGILARTGSTPDKHRLGASQGNEHPLVLLFGAAFCGPHVSFWFRKADPLGDVGINGELDTEHLDLEISGCRSRRTARGSLLKLRQKFRRGEATVDDLVFGWCEVMDLSDMTGKVMGCVVTKGAGNSHFESPVDSLSGSVWCVVFSLTFIGRDMLVLAPLNQRKIEGEKTLKKRVLD
jgi:hypothetical protein